MVITCCRLSGAVVSVSGGGNSGSNVYRSNTHTDKSGEAHFLSLSPGEYFVKPQLKEFEFSPKHNLININEGQTSTVNFEAKRVAFSAFGKIRYNSWLRVSNWLGCVTSDFTVRRISLSKRDDSSAVIWGNDSLVPFFGLDIVIAKPDWLI